MKYIYLDSHDDPVGPVDESVIVQEIRAGNLHGDSALRNAVLQEFYTVADFPCFQPYLPQDNSRQTAARTGGFAGLKKLAQAREAQKLQSALGVAMTPGDASVFRRICAMLTDVLFLLPVLLLIFLPSMAGMHVWGTLDREECLLQLEFSRTFKEKLALDAAGEKTVSKSAAVQTAKPKPAAVSAEGNSGTVLGRALNGSRAKLNRIAGQHNADLERAAGDSTPVPTKKTPPVAAKKRQASAENGKRRQDASKSSGSLVSSAVQQGMEAPPVSIRKMPGGEWAGRMLPEKIQFWEALWAEAVSPSGTDAASAVPSAAAPGIAAVSGRMPGKLLITGCSIHPDYLQLRLGSGIRKIPRDEFAGNYRKPLKWAVLAVLLYYTFCFSVFAQTFGMWFWGIFLTRSRVAEVLPLRALLYTAVMLLCGAVMIPCVLLTKRSLADWLCRVRQIGVGSVSRT